MSLTSQWLLYFLIAQSTICGIILTQLFLSPPCLIYHEFLLVLFQNITQVPTTSISTPSPSPLLLSQFNLSPFLNRITTNPCLISQLHCDPFKHQTDCITLPLKTLQGLLTSLKVEPNSLQWPISAGPYELSNFISYCSHFHSLPSSYLGLLAVPQIHWACTSLRAFELAVASAAPLPHPCATRHVCD